MTYLIRSERGRVHASTNNQRPDCGGGHGARAAHWQRDIGPANCRACAKVALRKHKSFYPPIQDFQI